jgi:hypothetical protein
VGHLILVAMASPPNQPPSLSTTFPCFERNTHHVLVGSHARPAMCSPLYRTGTTCLQDRSTKHADVTDAQAHHLGWRENAEIACTRKPRAQSHNQNKHLLSCQIFLQAVRPEWAWKASRFHKHAQILPCSRLCFVIGHAYIILPSQFRSQSG